MHWLAANWFNLVQTVALIMTLVVATFALRSSGQAMKGSNALAILDSYRQVWGQLTTDPELHGVLRETMSNDEKLSTKEVFFIVQAINHTATAFEISQMGGVNPSVGIRRDVNNLMNLPAFKVVWDYNKQFQSPDYVKFIDECIAGIDLDKSLGKRPNIVQRISRGMWLNFKNGFPRKQPPKGALPISGQKKTQ